MKIKLFENFNPPVILNSYEDAEEKISSEDGIVLSGVPGDIEEIENSIKNIPHEQAFILITSKPGDVNNPTFKSDVFLVGGKKDGETSIGEYFDKEWTDPAGGTHSTVDDDPAAAYENKTIKTFSQLNEGTLISKRNMDLDSFRSQGSFFEDKQKNPVNEASENRVALEYDDFVKLVNGEEVITTGSQGSVRIILQDIGFQAMEDAIKTASNK